MVQTAVSIPSFCVQYLSAVTQASFILLLADRNTVIIPLCTSSDAACIASALILTTSTAEIKDKGVCSGKNIKMHIVHWQTN